MEYISNKNSRFLILCKKLCSTSGERFQVGAVIVKGSRILGMGVNSSKTHPKSNGRFKTVHAEHQAIISCGLADLNNAVIYVYRETKDKHPAMAKPCDACSSLLKSLGIKKVFYSKKDFPFYDLLKYN